jgi:hypothetical protein
MRSGAPGEIRTPDLLVRSRCLSENSGVMAIAANYLETPLITWLSACSVACIAIRIFSSGLLVGTKLGTFSWPLPIQPLV